MKAFEKPWSTSEPPATEILFLWGALAKPLWNGRISVKLCPALLRAICSRYMKSQMYSSATISALACTSPILHPSPIFIYKVSFNYGVLKENLSILLDVAMLFLAIFLLIKPSEYKIYKLYNCGSFAQQIRFKPNNLVSFSLIQHMRPT